MSYPAIMDEGQGRVFSHDEHDRIRVTIAEGYGARPLSNLISTRTLPGSMRPSRIWKAGPCG